MRGMLRAAPSGKPRMLDSVGLVNQQAADLERVANSREELALQKEEDQYQVKLLATEAGHRCVIVEQFERQATFVSFPPRSLEPNLRDVNQGHAPAPLGQQNCMPAGAAGKV